MYCRKCGAEIKEGARFCRNCGTQVASAGTEPYGEAPPQITNSENREKSKFKGWWDKSSTFKKVLFVAAAVAAGALVLALLIPLLEKIWMSLFLIAVVAGFFVSIFTGTKEERRDAREIAIKSALWIAAIIVIVAILVTKPDFITDLVKPGAGVREAYLSRYSETVTVEDAFDSFFDNGKWSTYKENGYSYVAFNGVCEYLGERVDARVIFKITGENFVVDHLDINGVEQNDLILYALLSKVYESY